MSSIPDTRLVGVIARSARCDYEHQARVRELDPHGRAKAWMRHEQPALQSMQLYAQALLNRLAQNSQDVRHRMRFWIVPAPTECNEVVSLLGIPDLAAEEGPLVVDLSKRYAKLGHGAATRLTLAATADSSHALLTARTEFVGHLTIQNITQQQTDLRDILTRLPSPRLTYPAPDPQLRYSPAPLVIPTALAQLQEPRGKPGPAAGDARLVIEHKLSLHEHINDVADVFANMARMANLTLAVTQ